MTNRKLGDLILSIFFVGLGSWLLIVIIQKKLMEFLEFYFGPNTVIVAIVLGLALISIGWYAIKKYKGV